MGNRKLYLALTIIAGIVFLAAFSITFIFLINGVDDLYPVPAYILLSVIPLSSFLFVYFFTKYISIFTALKSLRNENLYNLGEMTTFFGVQAFALKVSALSSLNP